uniref:Uncharacterized protein n=1 Tax=Arundo donax TaxID=35708 RepID=A0A0A8ZGW0_ARUDO
MSGHNFYNLGSQLSTSHRLTILALLLLGS